MIIILSQKEFNARTHNQRNRIAAAEEQLAAQVKKANKWEERYQKTVDNIIKNYGGDIDKALEANPRLKGTYAQGPHRDAIVNMLNGQKANEQAKVTKAVNSAKVQAEAAADQVHNYGKTRQSVRSESGNEFKAAGKKVNVQEGAKGDAQIKTQSGVKNGNRATETLTATSNRREADLNRITQSKPQQTKPVKIDRKGVSQDTIRHQSASDTGKKVDVLIDSASNKMKKSTWLGRNKKGIAIGAATAIGAAGLGYGLYRHNKKKKEQE